MKILIDAMGGDNAPLCVLQGAAQAAAEFGQGMDLVLLGDEAALKACAAQNHIDLAPFTIVPCSEVVDMHDDPVKAARHKPDSSLVKGLTMLKNGEGDAFVSAGSTGALHVGTSLIVRTLKGVKRPALATPMPGAKQNFLLLDCGANAECRPEMLNAFGTMGSVYAQKVMGRAQPQVALVNNGAEDTKGTPIYREAHQLLKANPCIRFAGNIEPRYIMDGDIDVVVCDGFVGNVVLKLTEGVAKTLLLLKRTVPARPRASKTPSARPRPACKTTCAAPCRRRSTPCRPPRRADRTTALPRRRRGLPAGERPGRCFSTVSRKKG